MVDRFTGTGVALVTPFNRENKIDFQALERILAHVIENGIDYLVIQGTTGESVTVKENEKKEILSLTNQRKKGKPVVFGIGGNDTQKIIDQFGIFNPDHYDAVLSVCPYYNKPSQTGLIDHFIAIADKSPKPVILYNVPGRTSVNLTAGSTVELSKHPNIIGTKEASGDFTQCITIVKETDPDFLLISGDDILALPLIAIGAKGLISVIANALPHEMSQVVQFGLKNKMHEAQDYIHKISDLCQLMFKEGNPGGVKGFLEVLGLCERHVRAPLSRVSETLISEIKLSYKDVK